jgi:hypothetical protein
MYACMYVNYGGFILNRSWIEVMEISVAALHQLRHCKPRDSVLQYPIIVEETILQTSLAGLLTSRLASPASLPTHPA